jgi:hypothetical protein
MAGGWRRLHNLYTSPNVIRVSSQGGDGAHRTHVRAEECIQKFWSGNLKEDRRRWEGYIGMYLVEIRLEGVDWMYLALDTDRWQVLVNTVINLWVP